MRWRRDFKRPPINTREDKDPLANLGHPVIGSVQVDDLQVVLSALPMVDRSNLIPEELQPSFISTQIETENPAASKPRSRPPAPVKSESTEVSDLPANRRCRFTQEPPSVAEQEPDSFSALQLC